MDFTLDEAGNDGIQDVNLSFLNDLPPHATADFDQAQPFSDALLSSIEAPAESFNNFDLNDLAAAEQWGDVLQNDTGDYHRFENYIPQFERPEKPCDYCRSKHLDCYKRKGQTDCHPCKSLFRECSLNSTTMEASNYAYNARGTFFDALHSVREDCCIEQGSRTTIKFLNSKTTAAQTANPGDDHPGSSRRNGIRFPRHAVKTLREWLDDNQAHPYPSEEEKAELEERTGLKPNQIANWLANARRRRKVMTKAIRPRPSMSPSRASTPAIDITQPDKPWDELNPLERWQHSPPENEPAAMNDIADAVAHADLPDGASTPSESGNRRHKGSSTGSGVSGMRAPSTTSAETSQASSLSNSSAAFSHGSSQGSFGSFSSSLAGKKDRRRRKRAAPARQTADDKKKRVFQCTFCTDTFKSKYDWTRHEKSLHLSLEKFICAPLGPTIIDKESGEKVCVYCGLHNPPDDHGETHNHSACEEKGHDSRTFYRKDHLRQHLRLLHGCQLLPSMDAWKFTTTNINSRCGFCAQRFTLWQDRVDHLTGHFRAGTRMIDWKGCRGLDPAIAAQVTNAMPPYLIGIESLSPNPFSATQETQCFAMHDAGHLFNTCSSGLQPAWLNDGSSPEIPSKATCWEILTIRLGKYANDCVKQGIVLTDEMLQNRARLDLYGSDDTWNQTAADNPEWLDLFKKAHGLDLIPSTIGGQGEKAPEDLEWYSDLGLRIPFHIQLAQFNNDRRHVSMEKDGAHKARERKDREASIGMRDMYAKLCSIRLLHDMEVDCPHISCKENVVEFTLKTAPDKSIRVKQRWCKDDLTTSNSAVLANFITLANSCVPIAEISAEEEEKQEHAAKVQAARARAACLEHLQRGEVDKCPFHDSNIILGDRRDAHQAALAKDASLKALTAMEATEFGSCCEKCLDDVPGIGQLNALAAQNDATQAFVASECPSLEDPDDVHRAEYGYLPRHKAHLPPEVAKRFATITGAWEDSGKMPMAFSTTGANVAAQTVTTTGSMMEFLGSAGTHLPFSTDMSSSSLTVPQLSLAEQQLFAESLGLTSSEEELSNQVSPVEEMPIVTNDIMAPTVDAIYDIPWTAADMPSPMTGTEAAQGSFGDLNLDEMNFDSVFDMQMDDHI